MSLRLIDLGIIIFPSIRSIAYFDILQKLGFFPKEIILMNGKIPKLDELKKENEKFSYNKNFFDINLNIRSEIENSKAEVREVETSDINANSIRVSLKKFNSKYFIFSGGGILRNEILNSGKEFIHIHPGILPYYRGSTCFYYSLLNDYSLGSTAFIMNEGIDTGRIIDFTKFRLNYKIQNEQQFFLDYVLDPFIRSVTLRKVIELFLLNKKFSGIEQSNEKRTNYFIMHPLLRYLTLNKINKSFDENKPTGIFELKNQTS